MKTLLLALCAGAVLSLTRTCYGKERAALSMAEAVRIALENHPATRSAEAALSASRGKFWRGISPPPPELSLDYGYVPTGRPLSAFGEKNLEINQTIEFPLVTLSKGAGLSHEVNARESDLVSVRLEVVANAKLAYIRAMAAQQRLLLSGENLSTAESFLHEAEIRKNVGEGTRLEFLTAQTQRTLASNVVETARAALSTALSQLRGALGWPPQSNNPSLSLTDSLTYTPVALDPDSLQSLAQRINPQIVSFANRLGTAEAERSAAWMSVFPSFNFQYYRQTVGNDPNLYGMKFGISLPLWFLFDNRGQVQEASANLAIASESLRSVRTSVSLDVATAYTEYANSKRQVELQQREILPQAEEVFRVASVSYHAGEAGYVEFLQALQTLTGARNASLDALVEYNSALVRLEKSVGQHSEFIPEH